MGEEGGAGETTNEENSYTVVKLILNRSSKRYYNRDIRSWIQL